ncbi:MAG: arsenate reductase (glutaredoxin) [Pseudohongiella sp.]|nr:arsenate reductase (glutaredoxin) [Pseudohongiella sp.]MDO9521625.1 arsenate reductase (glutaredoxin) [Pseudohongiella sp.]MDP2127852.1 arsenate reductase (glutaredoxin) [Pseudohongiella sp.]
MSKFEIFHNPACSKSRQTLALLRSLGIEPRQRLYLQDAPDEKTIRFLVKALNADVRSLLRSSEAAYQEAGLDDQNLSEQQLINALLENPKLLQRPIVISGNRAVIGRPPENVLALIDN